jgi:2-octaprenyl-6-methoxyphenol hydroxylase
MTESAADIAVVGAGAAGLAAALALAQDGFRVALVGRLDPRRDGRTVALLHGSIRLLESLGQWSAARPDAAPLRTMRLIDDTGSLFRPPPVSFEAQEIGLEAFGWNIENATLVARLGEAVAADGRITHWAMPATGSAAAADRVVLSLEDGSPLSARLVIAADGRKSRLRQGTSIRVETWSYPQSAVTTVLAHEREHQDTSTEFHTRHGPFTLVPLPGRRSSLVWVTRSAEAQRLMALDDEGLALAVERQAQSFLGRMRVDGPRGVVPMSGLAVDRYWAPRLALVGEAAHVFPPIGAQGLNLGLRDVAALRDAIVDARDAGQDIGSDEPLERYQRGRALDVRLRTTAVDGLNRTLLSSLLPADLLRGAGLLALAGLGPLRRAMMREGVSPSIGLPRLMREPASVSERPASPAVR